MINWHYPRVELAEQFLDTFELGSTSTLTLFAPRRMGKTAFLLNDLVPMAQERGYRPIYVSFWQFEANPVACIQAGLDEARTGRGWKARLKGAMAKAPEVEAGVEGIGHLKLSQRAEVVEESELQALAAAFGELLKGRKPVLLCLDEVQHLATRTEFEPLVYFLRTLIDTNQAKLKVIFTGSSRDGLQKLFSRRKAPLFNASSQVDLPELGSPFVEHILGAFKQATGRELDRDAARKAFKQLNKVPYSFRVCIDSLMRQGGTDILGVVKAFLAEARPDAGYETTWESLKPIDQAVLVYLATQSKGIYQEESRQILAELLGFDEPAPVHSIQTAINRLRGNVIAPVGHGQWDFEDPAFKQWLVLQEHEA